MGGGVTSRHLPRGEGGGAGEERRGGVFRFEIRALAVSINRRGYINFYPDSWPPFRGLGTMHNREMREDFFI